jgi:hypothetical protein
MAPAEVDPRSPAYAEFARLHRLAHELRPGPDDRWDGRLFAIDGNGPWGSVDPRTGSIGLSGPHVLAHLGSTTRSPAVAQAVMTALRTSYQTRTALDVPDGDPHEVRTADTIALNAGLLERQALDDFGYFSMRAGYDGLRVDRQQFEGAVAATDHLLEYAARPGRARDLRQAVLDQPVSMQWDRIAGEIVRTRLGDSAEPSARGAVIAAMTRPGWAGIERGTARDGSELGATVTASVTATLEDLRRQHGAAPAADQGPAAERDLSDLPAPDTATRRRDPAELSPQHLFAAQTSAGGATSYRPDLGDGSRRGTPGPSTTHQPVVTRDGR